MVERPNVLVASTVAPYKLDGNELAWLTHELGADVFLAAEVDGRGLAAYDHSPLLPRVRALGGQIWTFSIDKDPLGAAVQHTGTSDRLVRICAGRNLIGEYALHHGAWTHVLFLDSDTEPAPDAIDRLLEVNRGMVFGNVPTYGHGVFIEDDGSRYPMPAIPGLPGDCRAHWSTAGFLLARRDVLRHVRWGYDADAGCTDDPTFARDAELIGKSLGQDWSPVTRHDVVGRHHPGSIVPVEQRGVDLRMYR